MNDNTNTTTIEQAKEQSHDDRPLWRKSKLDTDNYWQDVKGTIHRRDRARQHKRAARRQRAFRPQQFPVIPR